MKKDLDITSFLDKRVRSDLEMYKVVRVLNEIEWTKDQVLRSAIDLTSPA